MLDWSEYEAERTRRAGGEGGADADERAVIEALLVDVLQLSSTDAGRLWGDAIGYGRDSIAVVHVRDGVSHGYPSAGFPIVVKVYRRRNPRLLKWHAETFHRTPGVVGNARVQQSISAGDATDANGRRRSFAVLQYIPGMLLESWLAANGPPSPERAAALLREVFELVIALWATGLRPWDIRPGNLILEATTGRLVWIDTDACEAEAAVFGGRKDEWFHRDAVEERFLRRGPAILIGLILAGRKPGPWGADRALVGRAADALADSGLADALRALGRPDAPPYAERHARETLSDFLTRLTP